MRGIVRDFLGCDTICTLSFVCSKCGILLFRGYSARTCVYITFSDAILVDFPYPGTSFQMMGVSSDIFGLMS